MPPVRPGQFAAYAEGRRLREVAEMRRRGYPYRSHHPGWYGPHPRHRSGMSPWLLLFVVVPVVMTGGSLLAMAVLSLVLLGVGAAVAAVPVLVLGTVTFVAVRSGRRREAVRRGGARGTAPPPARPVAPPHPDLAWGHARARFHALRAEYAAFECDPMQVLRLPALADVSVPSTGRFVDAFAEAQALETDAFPPASHAAGFVAAADRAERAWRAARGAAERIRLSGLSPAERSSVERVIKLLTTARDSDSDAERLTAYAMARSELSKLDRAGVVYLPRTAQAALDAAARGALPA